jgi:RNA polymerase sigma-70 factor (ECF subfamily)
MSDPLETRASLILRLPDASDVVAWDEFMAIYSPLIFRLARRQGLQPTDADDLVQEVLTTVSRSLGSWLGKPERGRFRAWLFCIARNTAINFLTRPKHRLMGTGGSEGCDFLDTRATCNDASDDFDREYQRQVFRWASVRVREQIAERTWLAFWETTMEDRTVVDVAEELGMSVGSIYIARSRVMVRLRDFVQQFRRVTDEEFSCKL